ncbi:MAG: chemotaxis response regulator protein-glutamate methylesterase [Spirochaetota bacterium]|nr:chemotaxis response regulator protein-glutamate methylesterase [Spirochaetota bacterium]
MSNKIKVLIVDDSALVRKIFSDIIDKDPALEVVGIAQNGTIALRKMEELNPDIVTLDIEMPHLDGFGVLKEIVAKGYNAKVIMVSGLTLEGAQTTLKALELGAIDFITKPSGRSGELQGLSEALIGKIHEIAKVDISKFHRERKVTEVPADRPVKKIISSSDVPKKFVAIGTSTGGPQALKEVFMSGELPEDCAVLIVQHMPAEFTGPFAERLNHVSKLRVTEAKNNDPIQTGWAYVAPGHSHLEIAFQNGKPHIKLYQSEKVSGHMPSIDVLFRSVAKTCAKSTVAVIMTGMGRDGADGIKQIKLGGGRTLAQDKESSVVFGMNKEAIDIGAIEQVTPLREIAGSVNALVSKL